MRECLPAASTPRCQKDLSWAGLAPRAAALSATTEIRFSGPFFTRRRKIGSRETDTGGWLLQRSSPGPHAGAGCPYTTPDLLLCSSGPLISSTADWGFKSFAPHLAAPYLIWDYVDSRSLGAATSRANPAQDGIRAWCSGRVRLERPSADRTLSGLRRRVGVRRLEGVGAGSAPCAAPTAGRTACTSWSTVPRLGRPARCASPESGMSR